MNDNIYLIGPMGSGKSAVGRQLARDIGRRFYDADSEIERRTGVEIALIFEKEGEDGFRARERDVIADLCALSDTVIATGGGAILSAASRELLKSTGTVIYLQTSVEEQLRRTRRTRTRPLLQTDDPRAVLEKLSEIRTPLYESIADVTLNTGGRRVGAVAQLARRELERLGAIALKK